MADTPTPDDALRQLEWVQRFYDESLTDDELSQFNAMLRESPELCRVFVDYSKHCSVMFEALGVASLQQLPFDGVGQAVVSDKDDKYAGTFIAEAEHDRPLTMQEIVSAASYLARHTLLRKPVILGGITAAALGIMLFFVFQGGSPTSPTSQSIAEAPEKADSVVRTVASLTSVHDARWASADITAGDALYAGQRLTLTEGFAEITTSRGAVAILEAPCTVEMTDNANAIRLHAGKLVGVVETESAKGFVVRTPHLDVVDLGTQFGVDMSATGSVVRVFEGAVDLYADGAWSAGSQPVRLNAGWGSSMRASSSSVSAPAPITAQDFGRFVRQLDDAKAPGFAYRRAVLASSPLVYWRFDGELERVRNEAGHPQWDGAKVGRVERAQGVFGSAIQLSGQRESMGGIAGLAPIDLGSTQAYSMEVWCFVQSRHHGRITGLSVIDAEKVKTMPILGKIELLGPENFHGFGQAQHMRFVHRDPPSASSDTGANLFSPAPYPLHRWVHLVGVKDRGVMRLYIDGELVSELQDTQGVVQNTGVSLTIGGIAPPSLTDHVNANELPNTIFRPFHGLIDEVAVYATALSPETIHEHYRLGRTEPDIP